MPLHTEVVQSLRALSFEAAAKVVTAQGQTSLQKYYKLGILPVRVIDEIYTHWVPKALADAKIAIEKSLDNCVSKSVEFERASKEHWNARQAPDDLDENGFPTQRKGNQKANCEKKLSIAAFKRQEAYESYLRVRASHIGNLEDIKNTFTKEERAAIIAEVPDSQVNEIYESLVKPDLPELKIIDGLSL